MSLTANKGFDEIQAEDNRRQLLAAKGQLGRPLVTNPAVLGRHDPDLLKMFQEYMDKTKTVVDEALPKFAAEHPDFVLTDDEKKAIEQAKKDAEAHQKLLEEANENEYKITDTSTGLPKAPPVYTDEEKEAMETRKKALAESRKRELAAPSVTVTKTAEVKK